MRPVLQQLLHHDNSSSNNCFGACYLQLLLHVMCWCYLLHLCYGAILQLLRLFLLLVPPPALRLPGRTLNPKPLNP